MREVTDPKEFETTNLCLGAVVLSKITGSYFYGISPSTSTDGKRLLTIRYPSAQETTLRDVVGAFVRRRLTVDLYSYNRHLNLLRDELHKAEPHHALF